MPRDNICRAEENEKIIDIVERISLIAKNNQEKV